MKVKKFFAYVQLEDDSILEVITAEQAAELSNKSLPTIYNWIKGRKFDVVDLDRSYIIKQSFLQYLADKETK